MKNLHHITLVCLLLAVAQGQAQTNKLSVYGAGRFVMRSNDMSGLLYEGGVVGADTLAADTVNARRAIGGTALFDLGFIFTPNASTEIHALTRVTGDLDGFWGAGIGFQFRELYVRGLVKGKVRYRVGDLDLKLTPFTICNDAIDLVNARMSPTHLYADIVNYERFYANNAWRQQGVETDFRLRLPGQGNALDVYGFLTKNRQTDYFFTPDRLLGGGQLMFHRKGLGRIGYRYVRMFDVAPTAQFSESAASTTVQTVDMEIKPNVSPWVIYGEAGLSSVGYEAVEGAPADTSDYFLRLGLRTPNDNRNVKYYAEYVLVKAGFRSPGAQSRRVNYSSAPADMTFQTNSEVTRALTVFDIYQDATVYFNTITPILQDYNPAYANVTPYGLATPNRQGLRAGVSYAMDSLQTLWVDADVAYLSEVTGEGIDAYRSFFQVDLRGGYQLQTLWDGDKALMPEVHFHTEKTSRDGLSSENPAIAGIGQVDLQSTFIEASLSFEVAKNLFLHAGVMRLQAKGNEFLAQRDAFNAIEDYTAFEADLTDNTLYGGVKFDFSTKSHLLVQRRRSDISDNTRTGATYRWDQWLVTYNLFF